MRKYRAKYSWRWPLDLQSRYNGDMNQIDASTLDREQLIALTRWFAGMGVDCIVCEEPQDRFAAPALQAQGAQPAGNEPGNRKPPLNHVSAADRIVRAGPANAPPPPDEAALSAREAAAAAQDLEALRAALDAFEGCALKRTASRLVFSDGNPQAKVMFVGEAPGADEDRQGKPFVGRAGQLLDRMLAAIGLDRASVYIANAVPWRPPGNRTPTPQETAICLPFIRRQIELANPQVLVCIGASSAQTLLGIKEGITRARGKWYEYEIAGGRTIPALAMLHPAFLLRSPARKREAWMDLRALKKTLEG